MKKHYLSYLFLSIIFFGCSNNYNKGSLSLTMPFYHGREEVVVEEYTPEIKFTLDFTFSDETTLHRDAVAGEEVFLPEVPVGECKIEVFGYLGEMELPVFSGLNQFIVQEGENPPVVIKLKRIEQKGDESEVVVEPEVIEEPEQEVTEYEFTCSVQELINNTQTPVAGGIYYITTPNELQQIGTWTKSNLSKDVTYVLLNDIEMSSTYSSIIGSSSDKAFDGTFDGNGNKITYSVNASSSPASLFGTVGSTDSSVTTIIKNLIVCGSVSSSKDLAITGGIVGLAFGNVILDNCVSEVSVLSEKSSAAGGICGRVQKIADVSNVHIYNCINKGSVSGKNRVGGIIGDVADTTEIFNCANLGQISFSSDAAGGLIGAIDTQGEISKLNLLQNCYNVGEVLYTGSQLNYYYGGIIGSESSDNSVNVDLLVSNVIDCYWYLFTENTPSVASVTDDIDGIFIISAISSLDQILNIGKNKLGEKELYCKSWIVRTITVGNEIKQLPVF